jgi:hypothetical protein
MRRRRKRSKSWPRPTLTADQILAWAEPWAVTGPEHWHRYVPETGNWHGGTYTRWIAALSAAPDSRPLFPFSVAFPFSRLPNK